MKYPSYLKYKFRIAKRPYFLTILVTENCNSKCVMCNYWKKKSVGEITADEIRNIIKSSVLKDLSVIALTGGEIFMRKDIGEIIDLVYDESGVKPILGTNGMFPDLLDRLLKEKRNKIGGVMVSVDGIGKIHDKIRGKGTFNVAMRSLEILKKHKFPYTINMTLSKFNYDKLLETYNFFKDSLKGGCIFTYKVANVSAEHFGNNIKNDIYLTKDMAERVIEDAKNIPGKNLYDIFLDEWALENRRPCSCYAGITMIVITAHGDVQPCIHKPSIGSIRENSLEEIWYSDKAKEFRKMHKNCQDCYERCTTSDAYKIDLMKHVIRQKMKYSGPKSR